MKKRRQVFPPLNDMMRNPFIRLRVAIVVGMLLGAVATAAYSVIEHLSFINAVYMAVVVLSGVGLDTPRPLDTPGRILTIAVIVFGLGIVAWVAATVIEVLVSEQTFRLLGRKRMDRRISALSEHYIVCGYGRLGQQIAQMYTQDGVPFVVVEQDEARLETLRNLDYAHVEGDAADDDVLRSAGIDRAAALIAVTPMDAVNTFIVLSAHGLRPNLFIVARADNHQNEAKLYRAGASKVVSPHSLGGRWMGITALNPAVTEFVTAMTDLDHTQFVLNEFEVDSTTEFAGKTFGAANIKTQTGALVIALRHGAPSHEFVPNPPDSLPLVPGDILIAVGSAKQLSGLARLVRPQKPQSVLPKRVKLVGGALP